jgi:hypothetical protein
MQCETKNNSVKTDYEKVLKAENIALLFPSFNNRDVIMKLMATMPDDLALV